MDQERFDNLTRTLATGLSRRQALKLLGVGLISELFALVGYKTKGHAAAANLQQEQAYKLFLPLVAKACSEASACGSRKYCSADQTCLCIRSTEGDIRCGKIPSTCDVPLCQTSADCAHLGEGYFCDTPNSGCCSDSELPRCIAPCKPSCPPERQCGANCCPEGQRCIQGTCSACVLPTDGQGCVKIGGGVWPFSYEAWFCPTSSCQSGYCAGKELGQAGRCCASVEDIRTFVLSGQGQVLDGTLPPPCSLSATSELRPAGMQDGSWTPVLATDVTLRQSRAAYAESPVPTAAHVAADGEWLVNVPAGGICGGCTEGGLACFGQNSCGVDCLLEQTRDCCGTYKSGRKCCPACTDSRCRPNIPCMQPKPYTIISDTCPPVPDVPAGCQYYARRDACTFGKCKYYHIEAPRQCKSPPPTTIGLSEAALTCIRQCLQIADSAAFPGDRNANDCPTFGTIVNYHDRCFRLCGDFLGDDRFPTLLFWAVGEYD